MHYLDKFVDLHELHLPLEQSVEEKQNFLRELNNPEGKSFISNLLNSILAIPEDAWGFKDLPRRICFALNVNTAIQQECNIAYAPHVPHSYNYDNPVPYTVHQDLVIKDVWCWIDNLTGALVFEFRHSGYSWFRIDAYELLKWSTISIKSAEQ